MTFSLTTWCSGSSTVRKLFNWWIQRSSSCRELPNPNSCPPHHLFCLLHSTCFHLPWPWQMLPHLQEIRAKPVILSMSSVCRGNQVKSTKTSVSCLQAWGWECHGLGLHECCRHWGATVHWGNHECQHVLWHTEAEHDPLPSETGPQGSIPTW